MVDVDDVDDVTSSSALDVVEIKAVVVVIIAAMVVGVDLDVHVRVAARSLETLLAEASRRQCVVVVVVHIDVMAYLQEVSVFLSSRRCWQRTASTLRCRYR